MGKPYTTFQKGIAFDAYYAMGDRRNLYDLSTTLKDTEHFRDRAPGQTALKKWSREENWQKRIEQREIELNKNVEADTDYQKVKAVVNSKADYRVKISDTLTETDKLLQRLTTLVAKVSPRIAKGSTPDVDALDELIKELKIESIKDLKEVMEVIVKIQSLKAQLVKLDLVIMGEADSHTQISGLKVAFYFGDKLTESDI